VEATGVSPAVNQIEWSPLLFDAEVLEGHRERAVLLEGYSGLRGGILEHDVVTAIAKDLDRTPAQVVLRWHLQHGIVAIPKSREPERVRSNADLAGFEISADDMAALDSLGGSAS
jgi:2,5-diketo-D-gluconate reductase A